MRSTSPLFAPQAAATVLCFLLLALGGCSTPTPTLSVEGFSVPQKAALDAETVVETLRLAGLTDPQMVEHGPALRNALATQGGARLLNRELTLAMFMVRRSHIHGVAINRSAFYVPLAHDAQPAASD